MNIGIVSPYPPPNVKHAQLSGVASYTRNLACSMKDDTEHNLLVFANRMQDHHSCTEEGIEVVRCWDQGIRFPLQLATAVLKNRNRLNVLHIQYEVFLYGGLACAIAFPFLLAFLRLCRIPVVTTVHQVIPLARVSNQFLVEMGIKGNPIILKLGLYVLIRSIVRLSNAAIVHEPVFKDILARQYRCGGNVHVVPHGVEAVEYVPDRDSARSRLGINGQRTLLFFGYLANYKGLELLIDAFRNLKDDNYLLFIAGGEHPRLKGDPSYQQYLSHLRARGSAVSERIRFTGFVPEEDIPLYFSAADVAILPYTGIMSSSGPLSLCVAYSQPFLASNSLGSVVDETALLFDSDSWGLSTKIEEFFVDEELRTQSRAYCRRLLEERLWPNIGRKTCSVYRRTRTCS